MASLSATFASVPNTGRNLVAARSRTSMYLGSALLATIVFVNDASFRQADVENFKFDWQMILRLGVCGACGLYGLVHFGKSWSMLLTKPGLLVVLLGYWALLTVPLALNPVFSLGAVAALWCVILFAAAVKNELEPRWILASAIASLLAYLVASWFMYWFFPTLGREEQMLSDGEVIVRFGGLNHPNGLGCQAALTAAMLLVAGIERFIRWKSLVVPLALAAITVYATDSRTSVIAVAAVVVVALVRSNPLARVAALGLALVPLIVLVVGVRMMTAAHDATLDSALVTISRDGDSGEIYSMNGRTEVWNYALKRLSESPWVGYGYGAGRFIMKDNSFATHTAHNLLLNLMLGTGAIGGGLLLLQIAYLARRFLAAWDPFPDLLLVLVVVGGIAESVMLAPIPDSHTVLWLIAMFWRQGYVSDQRLSHNPLAES